MARRAPRAALGTADGARRPGRGGPAEHAGTRIRQTGGIDTPFTALDWPTLLSPTAPVDVSPGILLGILVAAAALSIPPVTWRWFGLFTTLVHELGHAVAAILTGRVVHGIRIRRNHSGDALSSGRGILGVVISGMLGYPAPAIVGAAQLWSVFNGYTALALFAGGVVLVVTILVIRNLFGILVVLASAAVSTLLWFYATPAVQSYALLVLGSALLVGAVRGLGTVVGVHVGRRDQLPTSDAYLLYRRTGVPSPVWLALFAIVIGGCMLLAATAFLTR
ncbi:M50 family metallopeptidase [Glaciibacter sp. 2TAF33]|uniref:M50 family metallopeptidase n=1 Tax=Glaciibacter sp. 2TAF33 TaxID=3233015 RepID=UPI003F8F4666